MKKTIFLLCVTLALTPVCECAVVTGGIEYNEEKASEISNIPAQTISSDFISMHIIDKNNCENQIALKQGIKKLKDREVVEFSDTSYGVVYFNEPLYSWYYTKSGCLINFTKKSNIEYPIHITKYKPDGSVANLGIKTSENESFIYSKDGKLIAHWLKNFCYNSSGNIIMTRKIVE